jgi:two-component system chemotaxis sensor kinase CheA
MPMTDWDLNEYLPAFVAECREILEEAEPGLVELQHAHSRTGALDSERLNAVFRLFHSIKGSAGSLRLHHLAAVTHEAETLLDHVRNSRTQLDPARIRLLLGAVDLIRTLVDRVETTRSDAGCEEQEGALLAAFREALSDARSRPATTVVQPGGAVHDLAPEALDRFVREALELLDTAERNLLDYEASGYSRDACLKEAFRAFHSIKGNAGMTGLARIERHSHGAENVLASFLDGSSRPGAGPLQWLLHAVDVLRVGMAAAADGEPDRPLVGEKALETPPPPAPAPEETPARKAPDKGPDASTSIRPGPPPVARRDMRVDLERLDRLANLVGELVIAESMVSNHPAITSRQEESLERAIHQLRRVSSDLQDLAMGLRMVPLAGAFRRLVRLVHDLSAKLEKRVTLDLLGEETEVDRTLIELMMDPLVHLVRNALDHGLETPAERRAAGKPETGRLRLEARHEGGDVVIVVRDDGRGLDSAKIRARAVERGLIPADAPTLGDDALQQLVCEPGFSTADRVTDTSGRGVGMDVVQRNVNRIRGRLVVRSRPGAGTAVTVRLPLTVAIIDGLRVRAGSAQVIIPLFSVRESRRLLPGQVTVLPGGLETILLHQEVVPLVRLHDLYRETPDTAEIQDALAVVVASGERTTALVVDEVLGQQQVVIKGLPAYLAGARGVSGCTVLGDGRISLILDVASLVQAAEARLTERNRTWASECASGR